MCIVPERVELENKISPSSLDTKMNDSTESLEEPKISFSHLLELAADNDVEGFKKHIELNPNAIDEVGLWYGPQLGGRGMVLEHRTPLMVAAMYGSLDVMNVILSLSEADVNRSCGRDKITALHLASSGGSVDAIDAVKLLLGNGADSNIPDTKGNHPFDVINVSRMLPQLRASLEDLLSYCGSFGKKEDLRVPIEGLKIDSLYISIPPLSEAPSSPMACKCNDVNNGPPQLFDQKKEYPVDPSLPDIKNSIYSTDEFRMYSFKIRPCSRAYSHDWTECPFVHPGENARRRDPRKYHYSCVPCPDFRKGSCRRGDMCEYAHGVFECWLHPAQYRTRLCKDGTACNRRVCFFAHTPEELRPLYPSTGSAVLSPRSVASGASVMDMAAAMSIFSGSPSGGPHSPSAWQQPNNIPTLHLPASNFQTSRLRSSLNARDMDLELEQRHILNDMSCFSPSGNLSARSKSMAPSNLDEFFSMEVSSPRFSDQLGGVFSPSHKSAVLNHFQQQNMLSPINTKAFSPKPSDMNHPLSFGMPSPGMMPLSPRGIDPDRKSVV